jgi:hypothetical protein
VLPEFTGCALVQDLQPFTARLTELETQREVAFL